MMTEQDQAAIVLQAGLGNPTAFYASKNQITIPKETFKKYFAASDFLKQYKKDHQEHPFMDGFHVFEKKRSGKFEIEWMERGQIYEIFKFENKDELVSFLVDKIFSNLGLQD